MYLDVNSNLVHLGLQPQMEPMLPYPRHYIVNLYRKKFYLHLVTVKLPVA
jgi:hypothetical protein